MTTSVVRFSDPSDSVRGVQRPSLVVECQRDGSEFERLSAVLQAVASDHFGASVLFLARAGHSNTPNKLQAHRGIWPIISDGVGHPVFTTTGPSLWISSEDSGRVGAFVGLAEVATEGLPVVLQRIARGSHEVVLLGKSSAVHDEALLRGLCETVLPAGARGVQWTALVPNLPSPFIVAVDSYGAFDDREAGLEFFGTQSRLEDLCNFLAAEV